MYIFVSSQTDKMKISLFCAAFVTVLFISLSCNKKSSTTPPDSNPSDIQIDLPNTSGVIYTNGFPLVVSGIIIDDDILTTAKVEIRNKTTGVILYQQTASAINIALYRFQWSWTVTGITVITPATVKITATDRYGYKVSKEIDIMLDN